MLYLSISILRYFLTWCHLPLSLLSDVLFVLHPPYSAPDRKSLFPPLDKSWSSVIVIHSVCTVSSCLHLLSVWSISPQNNCSPVFPSGSTVWSALAHHITTPQQTWKYCITSRLLLALILYHCTIKLKDFRSTTSLIWLHFRQHSHVF